MISIEQINQCLAEANVPELPEDCGDTEVLIARAIEAKVRAATLEEAAQLAERWGETHEPGITVNARNAGRKIATGIRSLNHPVEPKLERAEEAELADDSSINSVKLYRVKYAEVNYLYPSSGATIIGEENGG